MEKSMSSHLVLALAVALPLPGFGVALAQCPPDVCAVEYQEDFSSDPGWITDQPSNYFWDSGTETFHATTENCPSGAPPTRYAYTLIDYDGNSTTLEFDIQPTDLQWSAGVAFGLFDENLCIYPGFGCPDPHFVHVHIGRVDAGIHLELRVRGATGIHQLDQVFNVISEGTWYHCVLAYLSSPDAVVLTVTERETGVPVATLQVTEVGGLPDDLDYLGFARDPSGNSCCPNCPGYNDSNEATVNLDNVVFSESILSEPGTDDPPSEPEYDIPPFSGETHLVVVTHGWNTGQDTFDDFWDPMAQEIDAAADGNWLAWPYNWTADSCPLPQHPWCALNNAKSHGNALGQELALRQYDHVHLVAHSAGAALIGVASYWIDLLSPQTTIHTTFLDAFAGSIWPNGGYEQLYGGYSVPDPDLPGDPAGWSDHYFSREDTLPGFGICGWQSGLFTQLHLPNSFNADATALDPCYLPFFTHSSHKWPRCFYRYTVSGVLFDGCNEPSGDTALYGFPLSLEVQGEEWESQIQQYPIGALHILGSGVAGGGEGEQDDFVFEIRLDDPIDFTAVPYETSGGDTVIVEAAGFTATAEAGGAAWITLALDLPEPVNFVQFNAEFTSELGARGLLTVYCDAQQVGFIDEQYAQVNPSSMQSYADLEPGLHTLAFRLDSFAGVLSTVSVTEVSTGYGAFVPVGEPEELALDIRPGGCPNPLNRSSHGVLPVALVGTDSFDVMEIDLASILLSRADGIGGGVAPNEGPPGPHSEFDDVATPFEGELCDCHDLEGDGITDLSMKFKTDDVVEALELNDVPAGTELELVVTGALLDGTPFTASDCIVIADDDDDDHDDDDDDHDDDDDDDDDDHDDDDLNDDDGDE